MPSVTVGKALCGAKLHSGAPGPTAHPAAPVRALQVVQDLTLRAVQDQYATEDQYIATYVPLLWAETGAQLQRALGEKEYPPEPLRMVGHAEPPQFQRSGACPA